MTDDFQRKAASIVEDMQRRLHEDMLAQMDRDVMGTISGQVPPTFDDVKAGLERAGELMRQMRDTPEIRFQQVPYLRPGTMYELKESQRDPKTGQAYRLVFIHPDDVPTVRAAIAEMLASEPSLLRLMMPRGLEPEGPATAAEREAGLKWLESLP